MTAGPAGRRDSADYDAVLSALADSRRRAVLRILSEGNDTSMMVETLVERVARQFPPSDGTASADYRTSVLLALHHTHLPKLDACGLIVYEPEREQVRTTIDEFGREVLRLVDAHDIAN